MSEIENREAKMQAKFVLSEKRKVIFILALCQREIKMVYLYLLKLLISF